MLFHYVKLIHSERSAFQGRYPEATGIGIGYVGQGR
jgi:hypothetical protein